MPSLCDTGDVRITENLIPDAGALFEKLVAGIEWDSRIQSRKAASFGVPYNYSGIEWPAVPFPELLVPIRDRVAPLAGFTPNNCLAHYYATGQSTMGFHFDATEDLEPGSGIAVVSFGCERSITFRKREDKRVIERYPLLAGSLLWMSLGMQQHWLHAILGDTAATGGRVSLTFRQMKV